MRSRLYFQEQRASPVKLLARRMDRDPAPFDSYPRLADYLRLFRARRISCAITPLQLIFSGSWSWRIGVALGSVLLVASVIGLVVRSRARQRLRAYRELQLEHRSVNALLNPHFVFNAISNIQGLIRTGKASEAEAYLQELSRMIRRNMENLGSDLISLSAEFDLIRAYVNLQNLRGGPALTLSIQGLLDVAAQTEVPPLLIHSFVENAIVHGWTEGRAMEIVISLEQSVDGYLIISVQDNGRGINAAMSPSPDLSRTHMGLAFNRERLFRLNRFYNLEQSIDIADRSVDGAQGSIATIIVFGGLAGLFRTRGDSSIIR